MTPDTAAWQRLGSLLIRRRVDLDRRYKNRNLFATERGIEYRLVSDIERHRRTNFEETTLAVLEAAYALEPGSLRKALAGGDLIPLDAGTPPQRLTPLGERLTRRRGALDERWRNVHTFAAETRVDLLLIEAVETRPGAQPSDGQTAMLADAYRLPVETLHAALNGDDVEFPEPVISDDEAYVRSMEAGFGRREWAAVAAVFRAMFDPAPPAAAEQEHRRTA